jgi:peptidoglycan/LPS O-acetylase OafA/YrhL
VNGFYGVFLFFMISGFLITHAINDHFIGLFKIQPLRFYVQRAGRIWPLFFLYFFAGLLLFLAGTKAIPLYSDYFRTGGDYGIWFWLSIPTFLFNWFLVFENNWSYSIQWIILWSLAIEEQFYFFYPFVLRKSGNQKRLLSWLFFIIAAGIFWRFAVYFRDPGNSFIQSYASPGNFDLMALGILLYLAYQRYGEFFSRHRTASAFLCLGGLILILSAYFGTCKISSVSEIFIPEALGLGLFGFLLGGFHLSFFESKTLKILSLPGKYCYGCYLLHPVILFLIRPWMVRFNVFLAFFLFIVVTTLAAAISYRFFEMPVNRWIRKSFTRA